MFYDMFVSELAPLIGVFMACLFLYIITFIYIFRFIEILKKHKPRFNWDAQTAEHVGEYK